MSKEKIELSKELGVMTAIFTVINMVIGSGIFYKAGQVIQLTQVPGLAIVALLLAGFIAVAGGFCSAELATSIPNGGGMTDWLTRIYGPRVGFLCGWTFVVVAFPAFAAALMIGFGQQFTLVFNLPESYTLAIGVGAATFLTFMNILGTRVGGAVTIVFTLGKLIPVVLMIVFGILKGQEGVAGLTPMVSAGGESTIIGFGAALLACMYVYDGWLQTSFLAEDMKNPKRDLPIAIVGGLISLIIIFALLFASYMMVLPFEQLANSINPATDVATALFGSMGGRFIGVGIMVSLFGTLNANLMLASRLIYSMSQGKVLPGSRYFNQLSKRYRTPIYGNFFILIMVSLFAFSGSYNILTDIATFSIWFFYTLTFLGVIVFRRQEPEIKREVKVPLYPVLPMFAVLAGIYIQMSYILNSTKIACVSIALILCGVVVYERRMKKM